MKKIIFAFSVLFANALAAQTVTPAINKELVQAKQGAIVKLENFLTEQLPLISYKKIVQPGRNGTTWYRKVLPIQCERREGTSKNGQKNNSRNKKPGQAADEGTNAALCIATAHYQLFFSC